MHAGKVFTRQQIEQMRNGMLNPVMVFKGGWNCRHSWVPVDPAWDNKLRSKVKSDLSPVEVGEGKGNITAFASEADVGSITQPQA